MQLVVDAIRGRNVAEALGILKYAPKVGGEYVGKLLLSAISNWQNKYPDMQIDEVELYVKEAFVTHGPMLKRFQPAPQGRAHRIRKRTSHVTIVVAAAEPFSVTENPTATTEN